MNRSEFLAITYHLFKAREKSRIQGVIGFGFSSRWLKSWRQILKPIRTPPATIVIAYYFGP